MQLNVRLSVASKTLPPTTNPAVAASVPRSIVSSPYDGLLKLTSLLLVCDVEERGDVGS